MSSSGAYLRIPTFLRAPILGAAPAAAPGLAINSFEYTGTDWEELEGAIFPYIMNTLEAPPYDAHALQSGAEHVKVGSNVRSHADGSTGVGEFDEDPPSYSSEVAGPSAPLNSLRAVRMAPHSPGGRVDVEQAGGRESQKQ